MLDPVAQMKDLLKRYDALMAKKNVQSAPSSEMGESVVNPVRTDWNGFPDAVIVHSTGTLAEHVDYLAAKSGDVEAALRLVNDFLTKEALLSIQALIESQKGHLIVAVHAEEMSGRNQIPMVFATLLKQYFGIVLDEKIVQAERAYRTGADGFGRLVKKVSFDGEVVRHARYILVDDAVTQGGTIADLKGYIESGGGVVVGVVALMAKPHSARLAITKATLGQLRKATGKALEEWWHEQFGYDFSRFTESEARYLAKQIHREGINTVRDRIFAARQAEHTR